jgi:hypothetical protein
MQQSTWIVAQAPEPAPWKHMGSKFKGEEAKLHAGDIIVIALIAGIVILGAWALTRFLARQDRLRRFNSPDALFNALCQAHGFNVAERKLLLAHARQQGLEAPGRLFLEPECFEVPPHSEFTSEEKQQLESLRFRLFGDGLDNPAQGVPAAGAGVAAGAVASAGAAGVAAGAVAESSDAFAS